MEVPEEMSIASLGLDASLGKAVQHLWDLDANRFQQGTDYVLNVQGGKKPYQKSDAASDPLFTSVDQRQFQSRPTFRTFYALLDNYVAETGVAENVTNTERREIKAFLRAIMETAPMQFCHKYCRANADNIPSDKEGFIKFLHSIWFQLYRRSRGGREDSSGFEHVFIGEVKDDKVSGFHNWVQLYMEEKKGALDYRGYIKPRNNGDAATNDDDSILTVQFAWNGIEKMVGTSFIGTSPEFEMALYTTCFLVGGEDNYVTLDTGVDVFDLNIRCYRMGSNQIGTSFPEAKSHYEEDE
jgi:poly(U)-specific endoribonuclease